MIPGVLVPLACSRFKMSSRLELVRWAVARQFRLSTHKARYSVHTKQIPPLWEWLSDVITTLFEVIAFPFVGFVVVCPTLSFILVEFVRTPYILCVDIWFILRDPAKASEARAKIEARAK